MHLRLAKYGMQCGKPEVQPLIRKKSSIYWRWWMIENNNHRLKSSIYLEHRSSGTKVLAVQLVQQNVKWLKKQPRLNLVPRFNRLGQFQHVNSHFERRHTPDKTSKKDPPSSCPLEQRTTAGGRRSNPHSRNEWASQIKLTTRKGFNCHFERHHAPDINMKMILVMLSLEQKTTAGGRRSNRRILICMSLHNQINNMGRIQSH